MSHYSNRTWICPFFKRDEKNAIFCEGGKVYFPEAKRCQEFASEYCGSHEYKKCTIAKMLFKHYEEDKNG